VVGASAGSRDHVHPQSWLSSAHYVIADAAGSREAGSVRRTGVRIDGCAAGIFVQPECAAGAVPTVFLHACHFIAGARLTAAFA
jgi:hypothetical protein